jgi:hypothetical protein
MTKNIITSSAALITFSLSQVAEVAAPLPVPPAQSGENRTESPLISLEIMLVGLGVLVGLCTIGCCVSFFRRRCREAEQQQAIRADVEAPAYLVMDNQLIL